ncbi:CDP-4-keto-6-deoxy-D-glucose-3-dehydrase [Lachnospiraceae bacterium]|nr:CDP-4-keto-6-deoxy-D-glucose-3-dehydrase [Lachnospiraceae bacterium]
MLDIPLMSNNIIKDDVQCLINFLSESDRFTNGPKVREFERAWSEWLGVKHSLFVNSGSSANFMTMAGIAELYGKGEIIVPAITWSSDIASVITAGHVPVFVDVNLHNFAMAEEELLSKITLQTKAIFLSHILGLNALTDKIIDTCKERNIILVEDVCESHGVTFKNRKAGTIGQVSNFSFYYAHHMSTIEGGMICTDDEDFYQQMRMYRSHGMLRESSDEEYKRNITAEYPDLNPEFIFMVPGFNMRSTELNAVLGLNQIKRLDENIRKRRENFALFCSLLDSGKYVTEFDLAGQSNYAFIVLLRENNPRMFEQITRLLATEHVEFRRGTAGGGNQLRQPYVRKRFPKETPQNYVNAEKIHFFGLYTGNYPDLEKEKIEKLCKLLNAV